MKKFLRGFKNAAEVHKQQERSKIRSEQLEKLRRLLEVGGHEAEPEFTQLLKDWKPDIEKAELTLRLKQYHDAVSERQERDRGSR
ncbi:MAG: hypothetical protein WA609_16365 [Terriglobales bacterium]|jgi:hypothetical protein